MGIYLPNMEMPKNCKECMFADFDDVDFDYELYCTANEKYADLDMCDHPMGWNCPLVEIPTPHGRLIDADKLKSRLVLDNDSNELQRISADILKWIDIQETVIEGSET